MFTVAKPSDVGQGWPDLAAVQLAASCIPAAPWAPAGYRYDVALGVEPPVEGVEGLRPRARHEVPTRRAVITVGPGALLLSLTTRFDGWEDVDEFRRTRDAALAAVRAQQSKGHQLLFPDHLEDGDGDGDGGRRVLPVWSRRSRANMVRQLALVDWTPVTAGCNASAVLLASARDGRPAMVTLTYPGDWRRWAKDGRTIKRHLDSFRLAWERDVNPVTDDGDGGLRAVWKLEFQKRGAPHFHLYAWCPATAQLRHGRGRGSWAETVTIRTWVAHTWARIVGATGEDRRRHELAGTAVDFTEGARYADPKRLAVYFTRHTAKGSKSKEHQHRAPEGFAPGRWWGMWRLERVTASVQVEDQVLVEARRLLRRWERAQGAGRPGRPARTRAQLVPRGPVSADGVRSRRKVARRAGTRSLSGREGGFLLVNDGPRMAAQLGRWLEQSHLALGSGSSDPSVNGTVVVAHGPTGKRFAALP